MRSMTDAAGSRCPAAKRPAWMLGALATAALVFVACGDADDHSGSTAEFDATVASEWMQLLHDRVKGDAVPPMRAARIFAYGSIAAYEAVLPGMSEHRSLSGQLNELTDLPQPESGQQYDVPSVASAATATVAAHLFPSSAQDTQMAIATLRDAQIEARDAAGVSGSVIDRSIEFGDALGAAINAWADTDGYNDTRGRPYTPPVGPQFWVPTAPNFAPALEPFWGDLRPMAMPASDSCVPESPVPFSADPGSPMHDEAFEVYDLGQNLTEEQRAIALFWADNPGQTATPPGHWLSIMIQLARERAMRLDEAATMYALVNIATNDAFISCWHEKFQTNLLRPITYITRYLDADWTPLIPTPPFPEYTSGHSAQSGAASVVLTELLGTVSFTDDTHAALGYPARTFSSFAEAAQEAAISRLYGGIHYRMGIENGVTQGHCVGQFAIDRIQVMR